MVTSIGPSARARRILIALFSCLIVSLVAVTASAQEVGPALYSGMRWRQIGPFRAGRVTAVSGVPGDPAVFYIGTAGGGAWKTEDAGTVWKPIADQIHVASIGGLVVSPSNPNIVYLGTGDVSDVGGAINAGNGVWKSEDSGATWQHAGLDKSFQIGTLWIDPKDPNIVFAAALGHTFSKDADRGVYKTTDGGKSWRKVLYKDDQTGAIDVSFDPSDPKTGFAALWTHYVTTNNPRALLDGSNGGFIYKTTDGGETWTPVTGGGLPDKRTGRIGVAVRGQRVFAIVSATPGNGLYRSDDSGSTWKLITRDKRVQGNGYFSRVFIDPKNADVVYVGQTSLYRSSDGGVNFMAFKGAPGGDDNHVLWVDPTNSNWMIMGSDQGATISLDGGRSWSTWYNQPTGQIYHLSTDNRFPYWVYGTQQDSGSVATLSRGDYGAVTMLDWDPIGGYEFGYIIPDPSNPDIVIAGGEARRLVKIDRKSRQVSTIAANVSRDEDWRLAINPPLAFSPQDVHVLYEGTQYLLETRDGGMSWKMLSPDLTKRPGSEQAQKKVEEAKKQTTKKAKTEEETETTAPQDRSAINTFAPSTVKAGELWVGTTDGLVQLTVDNGRTWKDVSPQGLTKDSLVSMVEASRFDASTAYVAVDEHLNDDFRPHIYRTQDLGKSWQECNTGIHDEDFVRVVREDPVRKGLLYAGTENGAYVSFDACGHWQSLQMNLPTVSVRDLVVHGDDLVAGTYGRAFWVLDDVTPLRQASAEIAGKDAFLFRPQAAIRVRRDQNQDTPLPPEMPAGDNPPEGAVLDYFLKSAPAGEISIDIYDHAGALVRHLTSTPEPPSKEDPPPVPDYWVGHPKPLSRDAGMNRFAWDLRYESPKALRHEYLISALYGNTPGDPLGPLVAPGVYEVRLTVNGQVLRQPLKVVSDPRVHVSAADFAAQLALEQKTARLITRSFELHEMADAVRQKVSDAVAHGGSPDSLRDLEKKLTQLEGTEQRGFNAGRPKPSFTLINGEASNLLSTIDMADASPANGLRNAFHDYCLDLKKTIEDWNALMSNESAALKSAEADARTAAPYTEDCGTEFAPAPKRPGDAVQPAAQKKPAAKPAATKK